MKFYWVFSYYNYYPSGGMEDFVSAHETLEDAQQAASKLEWDSDVVKIIDIRTYCGLTTS